MNGISASPSPSALARGGRYAALCLITAYRVLISPLIVALFGRACRFEPSCSVYASEAIGRHGLLGGGYLALRRLLRCRPLGGYGFDPVPRAGRGEL